MKKLYLIHGWGGSPTSEPWFNWLKEECEKKDIRVISPIMPNTDSPIMGEWISKLEEVIENLNEDTFFVGHSMGCQTILRYLSKIDKNIKVGKIIFVAPWNNLDERSIEEEGEESVEIVKSWISVPIDFDAVKSHLTKVLTIFSNDDPYVPLSEMKIFKERLGAETLLKNNEEHFNETKEIPEIMEFVLS